VRTVYKIAGTSASITGTLIAYFAVTWHLTMRRFAAYIVTRKATLTSIWLQSLSVHCCQRTTVFKSCIVVSMLDLSLDNGHLEYVINFLHSNLRKLRFSGNKIYCFPWKELVSVPTFRRSTIGDLNSLGKKCSFFSTMVHWLSFQKLKKAKKAPYWASARERFTYN